VRKGPPTFWHKGNVVGPFRPLVLSLLSLISQNSPKQLGMVSPELHAISPCGTRLVSGSGDGTIRLWTIDPPAEVAIYYAEAAII
jgi:WD40 repeat protein